MAHQLLVVISSAKWVAEDFASTGFATKHEYGFDLPAQDAALWCTGSFMNRLLASGRVPPAASGGTLLLDGQHELLGRIAESFLARDMAQIASKWGGPVFIKPAEAKLPSMPARSYESFEQFKETLGEMAEARGWDAEDAGLLTFTVSEVTGWDREFRCFVADGKVVGSSFYLDAAGVTWDHFEVGAEAPDSREAAAWAQRAVEALASSHEGAGRKLPSGFVLDVGERDGMFTVIEANASWSSNPYHCNMNGVLASVLASQRVIDPVWAWTPDHPLLMSARPLPRP